MRNTFVLAAVLVVCLVSVASAKKKSADPHECEGVFVVVGVFVS